MAKKEFFEQTNEINVSDQLTDVRKWGERTAETLSERSTVMMWALPCLGFVWWQPVFFWLGIPAFFVFMMIHLRYQPVVPFRYPVVNAMPPPGAPPKKRKKGEKKKTAAELKAAGGGGDGILFFGSVRSSSPFEDFKEIWQGDDDMRKHLLIMGSTGSGKSETLKGIFFNALCWSSGFFVADGKADNKLPTDVYAMARSVGRDDDLLWFNCLLGGQTPEEVRKSRRRRTNKLNTFSSSDADTIIQMGANLLPKAEGDGKAWQEKALAFWRAVVVALCYKRDVNVLGASRLEISVSTFIDYMGLDKVGELYIEGLREAQSQNNEWSHGFAGIRSYLESGVPGYKIDKLLAKNDMSAEKKAPAPAMNMAGGRPPPGKAASTDQESTAYEQHAYRSGQLTPVLNLLDKTYGHIFRDKYSEIDMIDVTLNNRILGMLIPSLEKSAQEAENLGKLAIACLRVMMGRNLGADIEGSKQELLDSKATKANYPYIVALDELGYYFADGIAVMFAQARSLGMCMIAAAQDLEKLTEGSRAAEAGAMMANSVNKLFMRIDDVNKTAKLVQDTLGKAQVAIRDDYESNDQGYKKSLNVKIVERERASLKEMQGMQAGQGIFNASGKTYRISSFYMGADLEEHMVKEFHVNRFLQYPTPTNQEVLAFSIAAEGVVDKLAKGNNLLSILRHEREAPMRASRDAMIIAVAKAADRLPLSVKAAERGIHLYEAAKAAILVEMSAQEAGASTVSGDQSPDHHPSGQAQELDDLLSGGVTLESADHEEQAEDPLAAQEQELLAFLGGDSGSANPLKRKPAVEVLSGEAADAHEIHHKDQAELHRIISSELPIDAMLHAGRSINMLPRGGPLSMGSLIARTGEGTPADADSFMRSRAEEAGIVLARQAAMDPAGGFNVVGFTEATNSKVIELERELGNPKPAGGALTLERLAARQVTPRLPALSPNLKPEVADVFNELDSLLG